MSKKQKMVLCRNCNTPIPKTAKVCPSCGAKNKKPFYKHFCFWVLILVVAIGGYKKLNNLKEEKFDWEEIQLCDQLPKPKSKTGEIISNSGDGFQLAVNKVKGSDYKKYIEQCQDMGYTIDINTSGNDFTAFDENGYEVELHLYDDTMRIELSAPIEMGNLNWPKSEIANLLPMPASTIGKVTRDDTTGCYIYVGETSIDDFGIYEDQCAEKGFSVDYEKGDRYYTADDAAGNSLSLTYVGNNVMTIELNKASETHATDTTDQVTSAPEQASDVTIETEQETEADNSNSQDSAELVDGMHSDFKQAMDSYEEFMNQYCDFMDKYEKSNGADPTLVIEYADYVAKYAQAMKDFEVWESKNLNATEAAYYLDVQTRINQKLAKFIQ